MPDPDQFPAMNDFQVRQLLLRLDKVIPSDAALLDDVIREITTVLARTACLADVETDVEAVALAIREALANAIVHGNRSDPEKPVRISITMDEDCDLLISVKDSGLGFDPSRLPNPIAAKNLLAPHGRGIFLIRQVMDEVDFKFDHGTEVRMCRRQKWLE
jgi:anti-sigma regulatory factor (Ser/Thr protein kinase)